MFGSTFSDTIDCNFEFKFTQRWDITLNTQQNKKQTKVSVKEGMTRIVTMSNIMRRTILASVY